MDRPARIHILGASGCGVTTLGRALAERLGQAHLDVDDYFWEATDPPYSRARGREARVAMLREALERREGWVLSGSMCGWGDVFVPMLELVVFVTAPTAVRLERLRRRERERFGARVAAGGDMHANHEAFIAWAAAYDEGPVTERSRAMHEAWVARVGCAVVRVDGAIETAAQVECVLGLGGR